MFKCISFAYPTSPYADQHGHGKTGCYMVDTVSAGGFTREERAGPFSTWQDAHKHAEQIDLPYHRFSIKKD
jgi:nitrous oxide reductase accessory protein NosL